MEGVYELCRSSGGGLLFQATQQWSTPAFLDLQPREQAQNYSMAPLYTLIKGSVHVESQARDAVDLLAGAPRANAPGVPRALLSLRHMHGGGGVSRASPHGGMHACMLYERMRSSPEWRRARTSPRVALCTCAMPRFAHNSRPARHGRPTAAWPCPSAAMQPPACAKRAGPAAAAPAAAEAAAPGRVPATTAAARVERRHAAARRHPRDLPAARHLRRLTAARRPHRR